MKCAHCDASIEKTVIRLEHTYFRNCGDHDEKIVDSVVTVCSWRCAALTAADIARVDSLSKFNTDLVGTADPLDGVVICPGSGATVITRQVTSGHRSQCPVCTMWVSVDTDKMELVSHGRLPNAAASGTF